MSRNICETTCQFCGCDPVLVERPRPLRKEDAGPHYKEFRTMSVANAECPVCKAKYLAWVYPPTKGRHAGRSYYHNGAFYDLSFRSTFNDEPGESDLPVFEAERSWVRTRLLNPEEHSLSERLFFWLRRRIRSLME